MSKSRFRAGSPVVAVAYIRVSKDEQKLGPEAQRTAVEAWARSQGVRVAAWHVEHVCSVTPLDKRPALVAALASLREHGSGVLVVARRDRIARDPMLTAMLERAAESKGARVVSAAGEGNGATASDQFLRRILDAVAELERANIRARTTAALAVIRSRGHKTGGGVPFGFTLAADGRTLVPVESEQVTISRARALSAEGLGPSAIARALTSEGRVSRTGQPFAPMQAARMLGTLARAA